MNRRGAITAMAMLAAAGTTSSALAGFTITPTDVLHWGHGNVGRSVPGAPAGYTWVNATGNNMNQACLDPSGRAYWVGNYQSTPLVGTIPLNNTKGVFTATNSTDRALFQSIGDTGANVPGWAVTGTTMRPGNSTNSTSGIGSGAGTLRISGSNVAIGLQVHDNGATIAESGTTQNNSIHYTGTYAGVTNTAQRFDSVTLNSAAGGTAAGRINTDFKTANAQGQDLNSSGTSLLGMSVATSGTDFVTSGTGGGGQALANTNFLATKTAAGAYNVIAQGGQVAPNVPGGYFTNVNFANGTNRLNRNGEVVYTATMQNIGFVSATNNAVANIVNPGSGTHSTVYRSGDTAYDIGGQAFTTGGLFTSGRGFSNAGLIYPAALNGSDIITANGPTRNDSAVYVAKPTTLGASNADRDTNNTLVQRRGAAAPAVDITTGAATPANTFNGAANSSSLAMNNNGFIAYGQGLQGSAVTPNVSFQFDFNPPPTQTVVVPRTVGNDGAVVVGNLIDGFSILARRGDPAPWYTGKYMDIEVGGLNLTINNSNQILFQSKLTNFAPGTVVGTPGQLVSTLPPDDSRNVLWGWEPGLLTPYPIVAAGDQVEVDPGVFKTISSFGFNSLWNGDGGSLGFNDSGQFLVNLTFTDTTYALVKLSVPAPATGALAFMGLGLLARRRR